MNNKFVFFLCVCSLFFSGCTQKSNIEKLKSFVNDQTLSSLMQADFVTSNLTRTESDEIKRYLLFERKKDLVKQLKSKWENKEFAYMTNRMRLLYKVFGKKPEGGRALYLSLHGGGGAPKKLNDQQWLNQINLYTPIEGIYVAPRATTNTWDMWHLPQNDALLDSIISAAILFEDVNPNKVYLLGYSAGGDGVYQLAPRMADRWAAASMMAGHPGDASALNLRNIGFSIWVGALDSAYNRNDLGSKWGRLLDSLAIDDSKSYKHLCQIVPMKGHWMDRVDTAAISWMNQFVRNPLPEKIVWYQDNVLHKQFYWLSTKNPRKGDLVRIQRKGNHFVIKECTADELTISLNDNLIDYELPVVISYLGKTIYNKKVKRTILSIYKSVTQRFDPSLVFDGEINIKINH